MQVLQLILKWVRANVYVVVCAAVMIAAPLSMWLLSSGMNARVREEVQKRVNKMSAMGKFETTNVSLEDPVPGNEPVSGRIAVNRRFLDRYQVVVDLLREDARQIKEEVLRVNRKDRKVLNESLFPTPSKNDIEVLPSDMYRQLIAAYEALLKDVHAGSPPSAEEVTEALNQSRERYLSSVLKHSSEALTASERADLTTQLVNARMLFCQDAAAAISMYATLGDLYVPAISQKPVRAEGQGMVDMFYWQWHFWIKEDVLRALAEANRPYHSVIEAPVKRVFSITIQQAPSAAAVSSGEGGGESGGSPGGFAAPPSSGGRSGGGGGGAAAPMPVMVADPAAEVPLDYKITFTGRHTNPIYEVFYVGVDLVVDSARVPAVLDALAKHNFMTVVSAEVSSLDAFDALKDGYFYGDAPVSRLTLTVESVWLREWIAPFMPVELKQALGIPVPAAPGTPG